MANVHAHVHITTNDLKQWSKLGRRDSKQSEWGHNSLSHWILPACWEFLTMSECKSAAAPSRVSGCKILCHEQKNRCVMVSHLSLNSDIYYSNRVSGIVFRFVASSWNSPPPLPSPRAIFCLNTSKTMINRYSHSQSIRHAELDQPLTQWFTQFILQRQGAIKTMTAPACPRRWLSPFRR